MLFVDWALTCSMSVWIEQTIFTFNPKRHTHIFILRTQCDYTWHRRVHHTLMNVQRRCVGQRRLVSEAEWFCWDRMGKTAIRAFVALPLSAYWASILSEREKTCSNMITHLTPLIHCTSCSVLASRLHFPEPLLPQNVETDTHASNAIEIPISTDWARLNGARLWRCNAARHIHRYAIEAAVATYWVFNQKRHTMTHMFWRCAYWFYYLTRPTALDPEMD